MNVTIPLLVEEIGPKEGQPPQFTVRPLLQGKPSAQSEHLSRAVTKLANQLRKELDQLGREPRQDELLRWTHFPEISEHRLKRRLVLRRGTAEMRVLVVAFSIFDRRIAMIPSLHGRWFEVRRGQKVADRAADVLTAFLNDAQKESDDFKIPEHFTAKVRQWVTSLELDVRLSPELKGPKETLFALLDGAGKMSGREELHKVARCLDWQYPDDLDRTVLRDTQVDELMKALSGEDRRPVLLVGPPRVGKTAIIHECVFRRVQKARSPHVSKQNVWLLAGQRLISGMSYVGQWENRVVAIFQEAAKQDHVLYFDDLLGLYYAGISASSDLTVAHVLKPYVERREFRVLAEITPEGLRVLQERDRGMADLFHIIPVRPTTEAETRTVLIQVMRQLEGRYRCRFDLEVLPQVLELGTRYQRELAQPGKSALFVRQLASRRPNEDINRQAVLGDFHVSSGLSVGFLDSRTRLERQKINDALRTQITGQDEAVDAMADTVCVAKARLNDPGRPLGTFLFLGPTGVGKTQCAKALAQYLFGDEKRLLRFDMNEFVDAWAAARLNGNSHDPEGLLTSAIRRQPFSIVLLDEIEKAHPAVFDLLLQLLGEGRLTDARGRTADFANAIVIMTSNLGAERAGASFGLRPGDRSDRDVYVAAAEQFFRPEFFNRIDRIVPFERLSREQIGRIAERLISDLLRRGGLAHRRCTLEVDPAAMQKVIDEGYHPQLGARALKRCVERQLTQPVAAHLAAADSKAPAVIRLYSGKDGITPHVQTLTMAERRPILPPSLNLDDWEDVLDRAEAAIDRIERQSAVLEPSGDMRQGELSSSHYRYLAIREFTQHLRRFVGHIDRRASRKPPIRAAVHAGSRPFRGPKRKLALVGADTSAWRDICAAQNLKAHLDLLESEPNGLGDDRSEQLLDLIHETALLEAMAAEPEGNKDRCLVWLRSTAEDIGQVGELLSAYRQLFSPAYGFAQSDLPRPQSAAGATGHECTTVLEMPGIYRVMSVEHGTHWIERASATLLPVQVIVVLLGDADPLEKLEELRHCVQTWRQQMSAGQATPEQDPFPLGPILRRYESSATLDLRSGMMARGMPAPQEMRKFILSQLTPPPELLE